MAPVGGGGLSVAQVVAADVDALDQGASQLQGYLSTLGDTTAAFKNDVVNPVTQSGAWSGSAASAAEASMSMIGKDLTATVENLTELVGLLHTAAAGYRSAQSYLEIAQQLATQHGLIVEDDWTVSLSATAIQANASGNMGYTSPTSASATAAAQRATASAESGVNELLQLAQDAATQVEAQVVPDIYNQDLSWTSRAFLSSAGANEQSAAAMDASVTASDLPPASFSSAQVNQWWNGLDAADQQYLIKTQSARIGALNGIPCVARDEANRALLKSEIAGDTKAIASLESQISALEANGTAYWKPGNVGPTEMTPQMRALQSQLDSLQGQLSSLSSLNTCLQSGGPDVTIGKKTTKLPLYLLGFNPSGTGQAIVAVGNPDTASNVAVYVPGLGSKMSNISNNVLDADRIAQQSDEDTGSMSTAAVCWLGYNAPGFTGVASESSARSAVPALTGFLTSLHAVNKKLDNLTLIGDSYGSTVCGLTAANSKLPINNLVFTGSPGTGVTNVDQLQIDPSHVWAGADYDDDVSKLNWFGPSPVLPEFGANQFGVQHYGLSGPVPGINAHSHYFDTGSESLQNVTDIVTGSYNKVRLDHGPDKGPLYDQPGGVDLNRPSTGVK